MRRHKRRRAGRRRERQSETDEGASAIARWRPTGSVEEEERRTSARPIVERAVVEEPPPCSSRPSPCKFVAAADVAAGLARRQARPNNVSTPPNNACFPQQPQA